MTGVQTCALPIYRLIIIHTEYTIQDEYISLFLYSVVLPSPRNATYKIHKVDSTIIFLPCYWTEKGSYAEGMISDNTDIYHLVFSYVSSDEALSVAVINKNSCRNS